MEEQCEYEELDGWDTQLGFEAIYKFGERYRRLAKNGRSHTKNEMADNAGRIISMNTF